MTLLIVNPNPKLPSRLYKSPSIRFKEKSNLSSKSKEKSTIKSKLRLAWSKPNPLKLPEI